LNLLTSEDRQIDRRNFVQRLTLDGSCADFGDIRRVERGLGPITRSEKKRKCGGVGSCDGGEISVYYRIVRIQFIVVLVSWLTH
jgi:hypothetical protein